MESSLIQFNSYKELLRSILHAENTPRGLQSQLAKYLNCQASYIYQVLRDKAEFTEDQAYLTTVFFNFTELEREYFLLLTRYSKTAFPEVKKYLQAELEKIKERSLEMLEYADAKRADLSEEGWSYYFSDPHNSIVHLLTESEKFQTVEALSLKLNIDAKDISERLRQLQKFGFVKFENQRWIKASPSVHFSKSSDYNLNLHLLTRAQALSSILKKESKSIHFSSLFSLDMQAYEELRVLISKNINRIQKKIHEGGSDEVFVLCLDLFSPLDVEV